MDNIRHAYIQLRCRPILVFLLLFLLFFFLILPCSACSLIVVFVVVIVISAAVPRVGMTMLRCGAGAGARMGGRVRGG